MSTHPSNEQRLAEIQRIADQYNGKYADAGRSRYLQAINGITFGDSRNQGIVRGRNFYHQPLGVTLHAPEGWQIQNSPAQLTIISPERNAGVLVKLSPNTHNNRNEAIRQLLQPESGRVDATTINGLPATRFTGSKQNQKLEAAAITARDNDFVLMLAGRAARAGALPRRDAAHHRKFSRHECGRRPCGAPVRATHGGDAACRGCRRVS